MDKIYVRLCVETIARVAGAAQHSDSIGNDHVDMFVVNTDGVVEYPDYLRVHRDGGSRTKFRIDETNLDDLLKDDIFDALLHLRKNLPDECNSCDVMDLCGGGFLPGRCVDQSMELRVRSVLCFDQYYFFTGVVKVILPYLEVIGGRYRLGAGESRSAKRRIALG